MIAVRCRFVSTTTRVRVGKEVSEPLVNSESRESSNARWGKGVQFVIRFHESDVRGVEGLLYVYKMEGRSEKSKYSFGRARTHSQTSIDKPETDNPRLSIY